MLVQNPDEPAKKPELQSYTIDLNQTGPMVSRRFMPFRPCSSFAHVRRGALLTAAPLGGDEAWLLNCGLCRS